MSTKIKGKVYLIGAGPGDPDLISVKGKECLEKCTAVVYDNLVSPELIVTLSPETEKYYVGKKAGDHALPQDDINDLMVRLASEGKIVARLKGGDPFLFGRGGEEARYLREKNIEFEIIPGIPAAVAAAACSGIPGTDREYASFVVYATGHKAGDKTASDVPWEWIGAAEKGTIVIYMGVSEIENIVERLILSGMPSDRPAAIVERGATPTQRVFTAPLLELAQKAKEENVKPPALFIIGEVVNLRPYLQWFENKPLFGKRVMVTRPADQAIEMYKSLRQLGAEVLPYPTIATEEYFDADGWNTFKNIHSTNRWLIFTSENGVRYFFKQYMKQFNDIRGIGRFKIAAIGYGTKRALDKMNLRPDFIPSKATTADLVAEFVDKVQLENAVVVRVRGNLADDSVENKLRESSAEVVPLQVYNTYHPDWPEGFKEKLFENLPDVIVFTSGSTAYGFKTMLAEDEVKILTDEAVIVSIGPSTSSIIKKLGMPVTCQATEFNVSGVIETIVKHYEKTNR